MRKYSKFCPQCLSQLAEVDPDRSKYVVNGESVCSIFCAFARSTAYDRLIFETPYRNTGLSRQQDLFEGKRHAPDD